MDDQLPKTGHFVAPSSNPPINKGDDPQTPVPPIGRGIGGKEREVLSQVESALEEPLQLEEMVSKEVREVGVEIHPTTIELPPDLRKIGVSPSGSTASVVHQGGTSPSVSIPLSDQQIVVGLGGSIWSSVRWLAEWCLRQLKRAHIVLKVVGGKVMRVKYK